MLRGKIIKLARYQGCRPGDYICTADYAGHVEIVPITPGQEDAVYPAIPLRGLLAGKVYDSWNDSKLIEDVKVRCRQCIQDALRNRDRNEDTISYYTRLYTNLSRLQSLDGDEPATIAPPTPGKDRHSAMDRVFNELFGVVGVIQDSFTTTTNQKAMIGAHPSHVGKLVFLEVPLECDDPIEQVSGEYIVVGQSPDSLYVVSTCCCLAGIFVLRFPFSNEAGKELVILDEYEDDWFIQEFIERLDDMDTNDYDAIDCDAAETVSRQLERTLEKKLSDRATSMGKPFNVSGCTTKRECCGCV